jgi:predicted MFS family arabinose efflux permease
VPPGNSTRRAFAVLAVAKFIANMALRLAYPFNTDVARGLGVSLSSVGAALGVGELAGLASGAVGRDLDRGTYRRWVVVGALAVGVGGIGMALAHAVGGSIVFGVAFAAIVFGVSATTTAAHTWIGTHVEAGRRGRMMGIYETSWAFALLIGAPVAGALIAWVVWWAPFAGIGAAALGVAVAARRTVADDPHRRAASATVRRARPGHPLSSWLLLVTGVLLTLGAISSFATFGAWLKDRHGFTTGSVAVLTLALGVVELAGSGGIALAGDRIGLGRAVVGGSLVMSGAAISMTVGGNTLVVPAVAGVVMLFAGFEFAFVANLTRVSGAAGHQGGSFVGLNGTMMTASRAVAAAAATAAYDRWSMRPVAVFTVVAGLAAAAATVASTAGPTAAPTAGPTADER